MNAYETFRVQAAARRPLIEFIEAGLQDAGCTILHRSPASEAPFRLTFALPWGGRMGIVAYAFLANSVATRNRPTDEHRFQLKYGSKDGQLHELWQDPFGLYTTLLLGINAERGFFVGADPVLNSPTRLFISKEFKESQAHAALKTGWHAWTRTQYAKPHAQESEAEEVLIGGTRSQFLKYVLFEREARGEDQGHRHLLADKFRHMEPQSASRDVALMIGEGMEPTKPRLHALEREFELPSRELLEMIRGAPRLKMAVRGWVAQRHLANALSTLSVVREVEPIEADGQPDFRAYLRTGNPVLIECKNVMRVTDRYGRPKLDFQRTRAPMGNRCGRYYSPKEFQVVAACLHAKTERWDFVGRLTRDMPPHRSCAGRLANNVYIDDAWSDDLAELLISAAS